MQRQLKIIIDNAERTRKTDSRDFFQGILSASAQLARDPAAFSQKPGANLRDMGVLGEFLDDLPYKSDIMLLSEDDWYRMSVGEQTAFINRLNALVDETNALYNQRIAQARAAAAKKQEGDKPATDSDSPSEI